MGDIADIVMGGINATHDLFKIGYGVYQDQRDFKYAKKQTKINRQREDTAIQRRVQDAIAAGINPYDAISSGSGAGAGAVAQGSSHPLPELNVGSWFDGALAKQSLQQQKERTKQEKDMSSIINLQKAAALREDFLGRLAFQYQVGAEQGYSRPDVMRYEHDSNISDFDYFMQNPYLQSLKFNYDNAAYNSDMLRKENDWYTTNQILNSINSATGSVGNVAGAFSGGFGAYRNYQGGKYFRAQRNYFEPEFTYPKHEMGFHP